METNSKLNRRIFAVNSVAKERRKKREKKEGTERESDKRKKLTLLRFAFLLLAIPESMECRRLSILRNS
jgi:hypothetical protein